MTTPSAIGSVLAVIPARGGSKSIPAKNVFSLGGSPLVVYTIEDARRAAAVDRVVVSTDDEEIARVARQAGAEVVKRPASISGDEASTEEAILHVLDTLMANGGYEPELVVLLQPTSPLRAPGDIDASVETVLRENADSLFTACRWHGFIWRRELEQLRSLNYDFTRRQRRQDAPDELLENGSIYVFRTALLRTTGNRLGGKIAVYVMHPLESFQVDEPQDLELMERLLYRHVERPMVTELAAVRLMACDFDGVMTDNRVLTHQDGAEAVWCHRGDGWGVARLREAGVDVVVFSTERNPVVAARCRKLDITCHQGLDHKRAALESLATQRSLLPAQVAFLGNDTNDIDCLTWAGVPIVVADATAPAREAARYITGSRGGHGAVREVAEWILSARTDRGNQ